MAAREQSYLVRLVDVLRRGLADAALALLRNHRSGRRMRDMGAKNQRQLNYGGRGRRTTGSVGMPL